MPGNDSTRMTDTRADTPSVVDRTRLVAAGAPVVAARFLGRTAAFVLGEETVLLVPPGGGEQRAAVHQGGILAVASDGERLVTGGDDGRVAITSSNGDTAAIATDDKRRWIDHVACGPDGAVAWSAGKTAFMRSAKGETRTLDVASTVGGLAFAPKGVRLAVAHYNGVTLWFPNVQAAPEKLEWKGSHHDVAFNSDGRFVVTAMQEPALHGWRVADAKHMRMTGYSARVRSFGWTASGKWLATTGSEQLVLWPFQSKDGPMGKTPTMYAAFAVRALVVACHPRQEVVAVGYADGTLLLVRVDDGAEVLAKKPGASPLSALAWDSTGMLLAWGTEDGEAGVVDLGTQ
jgi:WD40 repeat protein